MADFRKSLLHEYHIDSGAKFVPYCGCSIVKNYTDGQIFEAEQVIENVGLFDSSFTGKVRLELTDLKVDIDKLFVKKVTTLAKGEVAENFLINENGELIDIVKVIKMADNDLFLLTSIERHSQVVKHFEKVLQQKELNSINYYDLSEALFSMNLLGSKAREVLSELGLGEDCLKDDMTSAVIEIAEIRVILIKVKNLGFEEFILLCSEDNFEDLWIAVYNTLNVFPIGFDAYNNIVLNNRDGVRRLKSPLTLFETALVKSEDLSTIVFIGKDKLLEKMSLSKDLMLLEFDSRRSLVENLEVFNSDCSEKISTILLRFYDVQKKINLAYCLVGKEKNLKKLEKIVVKYNNDEINGKIIEILT